MRAKRPLKGAGDSIFVSSGQSASRGRHAAHMARRGHGGPPVPSLTPDSAQLLGDRARRSDVPKGSGTGLSWNAPVLSLSSVSKKKEKRGMVRPKQTTPTAEPSSQAPEGPAGSLRPHRKARRAGEALRLLPRVSGARMGPDAPPSPRPARAARSQHPDTCFAGISVSLSNHKTWGSGGAGGGCMGLPSPHHMRSALVQILCSCNFHPGVCISV